MENCHPIFMNGGVEFQFTNGSIYFEIETKDPEDLILFYFCMRTTRLVRR